MATNQEIPQEEVDLGTLFSQIGKIFTNIFNAIGRFFKAIYHSIIVFLLFVRRNLMILVGATVLGVIAGVLIDMNKKPVYSSDMIVEVNYESAPLLYQKMEFLNTLLSRKDSISFSKLFNLVPSEAGKVKHFDVQPLESNKYNHIFYDEFQLTKDSVYTRGITYEDFMNRVSEKDYRYYTIHASAKTPKVFPKLNDSLIAVVENDYYKEIRDKKLEDLHFEKDILLKGIAQIDTLRKRYKETAYLELKRKAEKNSGVSFNTVNKPYKGNVDMDLYHQADSLRLLLRDINEQLLESEDILKIQSAFTIGKVGGGWLSKGWVRYGLLGFLLAFLTLVAIQFNKYLNKYEKNVRFK